MTSMLTEEHAQEAGPVGRVGPSKLQLGGAGPVVRIFRFRNAENENEREKGILGWGGTPKMESQTTKRPKATINH